MGEKATSLNNGKGVFAGKKMVYSNSKRVFARKIMR